MNRNKHQQLTNNDHWLLQLSPLFEKLGKNNITKLYFGTLHSISPSCYQKKCRLSYQMYFFPNRHFFLLPQCKNILLSYTSIFHIVQYL